MATHSRRELEGSLQWADLNVRVPDYAALSYRAAHNDDGALHEAEAALLPTGAVPARRRAFRLGRLAAHDALAAIGRDVGPVLAGPDREPIWPAGIAGSISHTTEVGVALVAPSAKTDGVGIDIEAIREAPELDRQVPRQEEAAWLDRFEPPERQFELLALFSAKESIFKAFFPSVRSFFGFHAAALTPTAAGYQASLVEAIDSRYPADRTFEIRRHRLSRGVLTWLILPKTD